MWNLESRGVYDRGASLIIENVLRDVENLKRDAGIIN